MKLLANYGPASSESGEPRTFALDGVAPRLSRPSYVADGACLVGDVVLGEHSSVWFCAVIRADNGPIRIGPLSARITAQNQTLECSPSTTSPTRQAPSAT